MARCTQAYEKDTVSEGIPMTLHPATLMVRTWLVCVLIFVVLPFDLVGREVTAYGFAILALFIGTFLAGGFTASPPLQAMPPAIKAQIDLRLVDRFLIPASVLASASLLFDFSQQGFLDLSASFIERNNRATALMTGSDIGGSVFFQIGFLLFPAAYVYAVRVISLETKINFLKLGIYGFLPPVLIGLTTGGRGSLLYGLIICYFALRTRRRMMNSASRERKRINPLMLLLGMVVGLVSLNYFVQVFVVRVEGFGGIENAMDHAARNWGVSFEGGRAAFMRSTIGEGNTYLVFIFSWYISQGLIISNEIFSFYTSPPAFGIYGIDLITALVRRIDGDIVASRLFGLLDLNIYGFLPSAYGSIFVDLRFWALPLVFLWGYLAGLVYRRGRESTELRWLIAAPFITAGIIFSPLNTPLGFNNGLVTHLWLIVALLASRNVAGKGALTREQPGPDLAAYS